MFRVVLVMLAVAALWPSSALASKRCGTVSHGKRAITVTVKRGHVTCREARRVAARLVSGKARYHQGASSADSWYELGHGWRGGLSTGYWGATKRHTRSYVLGKVIRWP